MMQYISMLRGINVSGKKKIKMADLELLYESLGFKNIITYIQSGNVIFNSKIKNIPKLETLIAEAIYNKYEFSVPVLIRTVQEMKTIVMQYQFATFDIEKDGTKVLVTFLDSVPAKDNISTLMGLVRKPEELMVRDKVIYLVCPNGYGKSKLTNNFIEKKLVVGATTRNWKTISRLCELTA